MGILAEDVARVRAGSDIVAIVGEHVALRRVGRRYQGLCPFHAEKTASFSVNATEGLYYCFGCGAKGDVITFVREVDHLDFAEAVERLAARAGLQLRYDDASPAASAERKRLAQLRETLARAVEWYHQRLLSSPDAAAARHYLRAERGYDGEVVRSYKLGWAPDGWDALARALKVGDDVLRDTGLGFVNARGRQQDGFRARVLFPIFDQRGDAIGFGGRTLPGGPPPKYRNSPETPLYKKGRVLYGLNWAKGAVVETGSVVVCEGYTDVIGLHQAGVPEAVATCGTALGEEHVQLLRNFGRRLVLAYDADAAGQAAAARVYEWERRFEIDVAVARLAPGRDPADVSREDPQALRMAIEGAVPFLAFRLERVLEGADVRSPEGRARAAEAALVVVAEHPSDLVRDQYVMRVADRTRIDPARLRERLERIVRGSAGPPVEVERPRVRRGGRDSAFGPAAGSAFGHAAGSAFGHAAVPRAEMEVLRIAVHCPDEVAHRLHETLFDGGVARRAYLALARADTLQDAIAEADETGDEELDVLLHRLAVEEPKSESDLALAALVRIAVERRMPHDPETLRWLKPTLDELSESSSQPAAIDRLVRWLGDRFQEGA